MTSSITWATVCDEASVPHPQLISESGRAVAAHHSVLVMETLGVTSQGNVQNVADGGAGRIRAAGP